MQDRFVFSWRSFHFLQSIIIPGSLTMEIVSMLLVDAVCLVCSVCLRCKENKRCQGNSAE